MSKLVVFDIGHGSNTYPPSKGIGSFAEHSFNSAVAIAAKELAEANGFSVVFSQQPYSPDVSLPSRSAWINAQHRATPILCLLSFHANAADSPTVSGHCVFHWGTSANGKKLAEIWNKEARALLPIPQFGQGIWASKKGEWTDFHILRETAPPAILMEHFFYSNPNELARCNTPDFIQLCAKVAVKTICEYAGVEYRKPIAANNNYEELQKKYNEIKGAYDTCQRSLMAEQIKTKELQQKLDNIKLILQ